jgi:pimeloyl-ACP methyl ester carboxylesterase
MTLEHLKRLLHVLLTVLIVLVSGGCATPVGVVSLGQNYGYAQIDRCAINSKKYSSYTASVLHRYDLERLYAKAPTRCLIELHARAAADERNDPLFALAELSFLQGKRGRSYQVDGHKLIAKNYFAASAVYAYLFLAKLEKEGSAVAFDRRFRIACDLYNRSLGYIVAQRKGPVTKIDPVIWLPVGSISVTNGFSDLPKPLKEYEVVVSADRYKIKGLSVRNRTAGMGTPIVLVSERKVRQGSVPVGTSATAFLRIQGGLEDFATGGLNCKVEIYAATASHSIMIDNRTIPLEQDITTPIAYTLSNPLYWQIEKTLFRFGQSAFEPGIYQSHPYQPGKIPILWVHGTMSSPVWWAEMWNTLMGDRKLRENYQYWFYLYDSGKPIVQSAVHLRKSIEDLLQKLDPEGKDPALRQMVVIGHSQGGLLTKATAIHTGDTLIRAVTGKTLAELELSPKDEKLVRAYTEFTPLPAVKRLIFISTPHRGSFLASNLARRLAKWFIHLPQQTMQTTAEVVRLIPPKGAQVQQTITSLDGMSPDNPGLLALAQIPVSPPIKAHSIIAIKDDAVPPDGDDGVVKYTSAHIGGAESELVVRSGHSCQDKPKTIEEVRRILLEHLGSAEKGSK